MAELFDRDSSEYRDIYEIEPEKELTCSKFAQV